jgi:hypothetical protein
MTQCRAGASDETGRACDLQKTLRNVTADNDGVVETTFTVRRTLDTSLYGTIDCATVAEGCILGWGGGTDLLFERGNVPLHFAGDFAGDPPVEGGGLPRTGSDATRLAAWGALAVISCVLLRVGTPSASARSRRDRRLARTQSPNP